MSKECNNCFNGKVVDPDKEVEADKLFDGGQFTYYEAMLKVGYVMCPKCNGTGKIEK
ncbi:hypothetical protein [Paenibacillus sp. GCM10028914]|uniref:hypothetical protein n=1 Tax=Paenibacillus sp. GCM10028914 TaxID=3273416 RepID=UPI003616D5E6